MSLANYRYYDQQCLKHHLCYSFLRPSISTANLLSNNWLQYVLERFSQKYCEELTLTLPDITTKSTPTYTKQTGQITIQFDRTLSNAEAPKRLSVSKKIPSAELIHETANATVICYNKFVQHRC